MSPLIRIAISGGSGVVAASLLHALIKFSHLDVHVFEPTATAFEKPGISLAISYNGRRALELLGPSMVKYFENAEPTSMQGFTCRLGQGPNEDDEVYVENAKESEEALVTLAQSTTFLQQLRSDLPQERIHTSKQLSRVNRKIDSLTLHFTDGTIHECDILIGADGIQSIVRRYILDDNESTALPRNTGYSVISIVKPYKDFQASFGENFLDPENPREIGWIGSGTFFEQKLLDEGQKAQSIICFYEKDSEISNRWNREISADEIRKISEQWTPRLSKAANELFCNEPKQSAIYFWEHPDAPSYVSGPVCVIGDAAHAMTPFQSAGAGITFEDIVILAALLGRVKSSAEAQVALKIYDHVRRPRTQAVVRSSLETGEIMTGRGKEVGLDPEKLRKSLPWRWDFIVYFDLKKHRDEAIEMMETELKKTE